MRTQTTAMSAAFTVCVLTAMVLAAPRASESEHHRQRVAESRLRLLAVALDAYQVDHAGLAPYNREVMVPGSVAPPETQQVRWPPPAWPPRPGAVVSLLCSSLVPAYIGDVTDLDPWGYPMLVAISEDRKSFTLVCTGRDGRLDTRPVQASGLIAFPPTDYDHDIVRVGDLFVMFPEGDAAQ